MSIQGKIDSSFTTEQRDLFASGIIAEIGVNAYAVWHAVKFYADYNTGEAYPGMRAIGAKLGLSQPTVLRAIESLKNARMVRVTKPHNKRRGQTYIARERMSVTVGGQVLCTIVIDYVPERLRGNVKRLTDAITTGKDPEAFAEVEIIPGEGFTWDEEYKCLRGRIDARKLPPADHSADEHHRAIGEAILSRIKRPHKTLK